MRKLARNKWVDHNGNALKLPKTFQQMADIVQSAVANNIRYTENRILYLQGLNKDRHGSRNEPSQRYMGIGAEVPTPVNGRQDIIKALADIGAANAKIAYSLMRALEGSK